MSQNPEEGRLTAEQQAEQLVDARKRTVEMKREYRTMRREKAAEAKANKWAANHKKQHEEAYTNLQDGDFFNGKEVITLRHPMNRRTRRIFAKRMNVHKTPEGWTHFNDHYKKKFGANKPLTEKDATKVTRSNITQALEAAKVTPKKEDK